MQRTIISGRECGLLLKDAPLLDRPNPNKGLASLLWKLEDTSKDCKG